MRDAACALAGTQPLPLQLPIPLTLTLNPLSSCKYLLFSPVIVPSCLHVSLPCPVLSIHIRFAPSIVPALWARRSLSQLSIIILSGIPFQSISPFRCLLLPFPSFLPTSVRPLCHTCTCRMRRQQAVASCTPTQVALVFIDLLLLLSPEKKKSGFPAIVLLRARSRDSAALCAYPTRRATIAHQQAPRLLISPLSGSIWEPLLFVCALL